MTNTNINEHSLAQALDPENPYFITTHLYWDCECDRDTSAQAPCSCARTAAHSRTNPPIPA